MFSRLGMLVPKHVQPFQSRSYYSTLNCFKISTKNHTFFPQMTPILTKPYKSTTPLTHATYTPTRSFRTTTPALDWHQKIDHKTGEYYYIDIFTGKKTNIAPPVYLPHDAPQESAALAFLRADRAPVTGVQKKKSVLRPFFTAMGIAGILYFLGEYGYLERLLGYSPPARPNIPYSKRVQERTKDLARGYDDFCKQ
jgi:hypothetical protein